MVIIMALILYQVGMLLNSDNVNYILSNQNKINKNLPDDVALSSIFNISNDTNNKLRYDFINNNINIYNCNIDNYYHFELKIRIEITI